MKVRRSRKSRGEEGGCLIWLLLLAAFGLLGWIWWEAGRPSLDITGSLPFPQRPQTNQAPPNLPLPGPAVRTNALPPQQAVELQIPPPPAFAEPRPVQTTLEAQVALLRRGISVGCIDSSAGPQTRTALRAFQRQEGIEQTGDLDASTKMRLRLAYPALRHYVITSNDLARLQPVPKTWLGKSQARRLDYETPLELVAELGQASQYLIKKLNPKVNWTNALPGTAVVIPNIDRPLPRSRAAFLRIELNNKVLQAFDSQTNLLAHMPCSIARQVEKRPVGLLFVAKLAPNPNYLFDPAVFSESVEAKRIGRKLVVPPGPNNPVGVAWIGLDKPGYGIHGTPAPEQVGRTESHGCFRLANWNAEYLMRMMWIDLPVHVVP
jgi:hypothetical protein